MADLRVPVTLLTGFLGAGKTTLLNAVLSDASSGRVAVIVNEFGEAGLDHDLIEQTSEDVVLMQSGCLCCTVRGELSQTMARLMARRNRGELSFDRVVIETTGLADPGPILQTMLMDSYLARTTKMDGVVTVADAANGPATLDAQFEAVSQIAVADMIILSKTDLADDDALTAFEARINALNPGVDILHAVKGDGVTAKLWGLSALREDASKPDILSWTRVSTPAADPLANLSGFSAAPQQDAKIPVHDTRIETASIVLDHPIADAVFDHWLNTLIGLRGADILRIKGIVFLEGIEAPFVFHGVQQIFNPPVQLKSWPKDDRRSRIVVIARDLTGSELQHSFKMLQSQTSDLADVQPGIAQARMTPDGEAATNG